MVPDWLEIRWSVVEKFRSGCCLWSCFSVAPSSTPRPRLYIARAQFSVQCQLGFLTVKFNLDYLFPDI